MHEIDKKLYELLVSKGLEVSMMGFMAIHEMIVTWDWSDSMGERYRAVGETMGENDRTVERIIRNCRRKAGHEEPNKIFMSKLAAEYQILKQK